MQIKQQQLEADEILKNAIPILENAEIALQNIDQKEVSVLKTLNKPPPAVDTVLSMVMMLKPIDGINENDGWNGAKQMMNNPARFVEELKKFSNRIGNVQEKTISKIRNLENKEKESMARIKEISSAAFNIYTWL